MKLINAIIDAYITVMGEEKWQSLTTEQQHDAIMILVKDTIKAIDAL